MKESFLLYKSFYEPIKELSTNDKGLLLDAIFEYQINGHEPMNTSRIYMPFMFFKNQFRLDDKKYEKIVERNKVNGSKGGRPKNPKNPVGYLETQKTQGNPNKPKKPDNDNDNDNDNEKDNVKDKEIKKPVFNFRKELLNLRIEEKIADAWMKVRKTKKATNTDVALDAIKKQIVLTGKTANECIKIAVENSWSGFKKSWMDNLSEGNGTPQRKKQITDVNPDIYNDPDRMKW